MVTGLPTCEVTGCTGHLGKFSSCLDEALYVMSGDGFDETTGDTEFEGHLALVHLGVDTTHALESGPEVTVAAGWYIVTTANSGTVFASSYESESVARELFDAAAARYEKWNDVDAHSSTCTGCVHDCPWKRTCPPPMGAPFCTVCDDHGEAGAASEECNDVDAYV